MPDSTGFAALLVQQGLQAEALLQMNRVCGHNGLLRVLRQFHYSGAKCSLAEPLA